MVKKKERVFVALGSNVGDRAGNLRRAMEEIRMLSAQGVPRVSRIYQTRPLGGMKQRDYYNAVAVFHTDASPLALLEKLKRIEKRFGRRSSEKWSPRALDIDIVFYGARRISLPKLKVPHPRIKERDFVLVPLAELSGRGKLPVFGRTAAKLLKDIASPDKTIARIAGCFPSDGGKQ